VPIGVEGSPLSKSIGETHEILLNHKQSSFTIEFVALNYIQGSKSQYAYILEGLENEWNLVGHKNSASYSYVKPGKYLFKVKGSNNDGLWNNTPATLKIIILPPFWQTAWAYTIYVVIFIALIFAFIRYRITRAKQIHLLELNQMKLQFFANISHELRTPLSLILSPAENILAYARKNKEIKGQLELIYKNSNRLFRLVNEIMDFSKAEESKLTISVQSGDIVKFTQELSNFFSDEALRRQIDYQFIAEPASIEAWVDRDKYEKIILNLLSNAFKFTPDNGTISIKIEKLANNRQQLNAKKYSIPKVSSKELLKISVIDNGKGISPVDINKVFERFYQGSNEDYTYQTGTGIGLSLTKTLVELHHGKIFVTSEKGKETCFTILMPLGNNHFKKSEIIQEPIDISSKISESPFSITEDKSNKPEPPQNAPTIMVVEDNYELRKYILSTLSVKYKILEAGDGEMGYNLAVENVPDLIISDIIMPNLSGIELCKQIKGNIVTSHIPIILLTAKITLEDQINGIETGADAYITKPFNVRYLEVITNNLIQSRQRLFKRFSQEVYILPKEITNNSLDQNFLENVINHIEENILSTELSVENLASHLLMSPGHIWRKIKSLTGQSTNEFIRTIRLKKAIKLIEEGNLNVSEIAYKVGFSSPAYFTKCFRKQYGKSPSRYFSDIKKKDDI
jgi:signal transduction histidine kinase/DNA-binding response OmpR family regulator